LNDPESEIYNRQHERSAEYVEMFKEKEGQKKYEGPTYENVQKALFTRAVIFMVLYQTSKALLQKTFNYPDCLVNWGGRAVNTAVDFVLKR
jgi:hypothetical protein